MMGDEQKMAFRKDHGTEWGHARYRMPKVHNDAIQKLQDEGRIIYADGLIRDGANTGIRCDEDGGFSLLFSKEGGLNNIPEMAEHTETIDGKEVHVVHVPNIINNTGPSSRLADMSPLMRNLEEKGLIAQHALGGLRVDDKLHVIDASGKTQSVLYAIGPITSGEFYESISMPAIRQCSHILGESIIQDHVLHNAKDFIPEYHPEVNEDGQIGYTCRLALENNGTGSLPSY